MAGGFKVLGCFETLEVCEFSISKISNLFPVLRIFDFSAWF